MIDTQVKTDLPTDLGDKPRVWMWPAMTVGDCAAAFVQPYAPSAECTNTWDTRNTSRFTHRRALCRWGPLQEHATQNTGKLREGWRPGNDCECPDVATIPHSANLCPPPLTRPTEHAYYRSGCFLVPHPLNGRMPDFREWRHGSAHT